MNCKLFLLQLCMMLFCVTLNGFAQTPQQDANEPSANMEAAIEKYYMAIGDQSRLYNGPEYSFYEPVIKGNAYFNDVNSFTPGTVEYDGYIYRNVPLMYDLFKDCVVMLLPNKAAKIRLLSERVQSFDLLGHHFIYINTDTLTKNGVSTGFYEQQYAGNHAAVYIKASKAIQETTSAGALETHFTSKNEIFVKGPQGYRNVSSESNLLSAFKDKSNELRQFIRANKLKFNSASQKQSITQVTAYYDRLTI